MDLLPKNFKQNSFAPAPPGAAGPGAPLGKSFFSGGNFWRAWERMKAVILRLVVILSGAALVLTLLFWGGLTLYKNSLNNKIDDLKKKQSEVFSAKDKELATKIVNFDQGIVLMDALLKSHLYPSVIFDKLAAATLPQVQWKSFNLSIKDSNVAVGGFTTNYSVLARQMTALSEEGFSNVKISNISLDKTGGVSFSAVFNFDPKILKK